MRDGSIHILAVGRLWFILTVYPQFHFQNIGCIIPHILVLLHLTNYNKTLMLSVHQVPLRSNLLCAKCQFCGLFNYYFLAFVVMTVVRKLNHMVRKNLVASVFFIFDFSQKTNS